MYGLIALYLGYAIYLIIFFRSKKTDFLSKKVTIVLGVKLLILTLLYFLFFDHKMTRDQRKENIQHVIIDKK